MEEFKKVAVFVNQNSELNLKPVEYCSLGLSVTWFSHVFAPRCNLIDVCIVSVRACICVHVSTICMYLCMHPCMYLCMHVCMHACMYVCTYYTVRTYVCMRVIMYVCEAEHSPHHEQLHIKVDSM